MGGFSIVHRETTGQGTFPKEIVTCSLEDGREFRLFCKYEMGYNHNAHGHRGGVAHEASVYRELLEPMRVSVPALRGVFADKEADEIWLILEYLEGNLRVKKSPDPAMMGLAARWIGRFHALSQDYLQTPRTSFLKSYDIEYYLGWAQRTLQYSAHLRDRYPWLELLYERFEEVIRTLLSVPDAVIHGEYYPKNVLVRDSTIYPVDWESAAVGAGEIDLASLTEAWPEAIVQECEAQYQAARWPDDPPYDLRRVLSAAQLYLHFRWLGDLPEAVVNTWRFEQLHTIGKQFGLL
jgi:aminoglycoside phosphotransferase (APT) family kinase protein